MFVRVLVMTLRRRTPHIKLNLTLLVGIFALGLLSMPPAGAHSSIVSSSPASDETLMSLPNRVQITFDEPLMVMGSAKTNVLQVLDTKGEQIDTGNSTTSGSVLSVDITDQGQTGTFTVSFRVVSSDGHPAEGSYNFKVDPSSSAQVTATEKPKVVSHAHQESFWVQHQDHILLIVAGLVFIGIWAEFDRRRKLSE